MYLLILESIGTAELIMIGLVALIIFGPRKLPEMMRSFGKTISEFKKSTNEFKQSWEKEVDIESIEKEVEDEKLLKDTNENSIGRKTYPLGVEFTAPEIKEIKAEDFELMAADAKNTQPASENQDSTPDTQLEEKTQTEDANQKQDWF